MKIGEVILIIGVIWIVNVVTFKRAPVMKNKGVKLKLLWRSRQGEMTYLIGGIKSRTARTFDFLFRHNLLPGGMTYVEYRNSGLDVEQAADEIFQDAINQGYTRVTLVSASLGYQIAARVGRFGGIYPRQVALNPCTGYDSLLPRVQKAARVVPVLPILGHLLGWAAILPLVRTAHGTWYSLQLLFDQFAACTGETCVGLTTAYDVVVISENDEVIDGGVIQRQFEALGPYHVLAGHTDFEKNGDRYAKVLKNVKL